MNVKFYEPRYKDGRVIAMADVELTDGVTVRGFKVYKSEKGVYGGVPSKSFIVEGQTRYWSQVVFETKELRAKFFDEFMALYRAWSDGQPKSA